LKYRIAGAEYHLYDSLDIEHFVGRFSYRFGTKIIVPEIGKLLRVKPVLPYIEIHVVDQCNLNCKGCGHFSPIADEWLIDPTNYVRDISQLKKLFSTIRVIRIMGGEPLLHPKVEQLLLQTRLIFSKADIRIVTNGILLNKMSDSFWETCKTNHISFDITVYPPLRNKIKFLFELLRAKGVKLNEFKKVDFFYAFYNNKGNSDRELNFQKCKAKWNICTNLRNGRIYSCPIPTYIHHFNKRFNTQIPSDAYVNIYSPNITGWDVRKALNEAPSTCRYCTYGWTKTPRFSWSTSKQTLSDWEGT
jgi:organic radical activating enzyme